MLPVDFFLTKQEFPGGVEFRCGGPRWERQIFTYRLNADEQYYEFWGLVENVFQLPVKVLLKKGKFPFIVTYSDYSDFRIFRLGTDDKLHEFHGSYDQILAIIRSSYGNYASLEKSGLREFKYNDLTFILPNQDGCFEQDFHDSYFEMNPKRVSENLGRPLVFIDNKKKDLILADKSLILPIRISFLEQIIRRVEDG